MIPHPAQFFSPQNEKFQMKGQENLTAMEMASQEKAGLASRDLQDCVRIMGQDQAPLDRDIETASRRARQCLAKIGPAFFQDIQTDQEPALARPVWDNAAVIAEDLEACLAQQIQRGW